MKKIINVNVVEKRLNGVVGLRGDKREKALSMAKDNTSGVTGVSWNAHDNRWRAHISINKKRVYLGNFLEFADACEARAIAEIENDYHVNHGKQCKGAV